ncbi:MAG: MarR family transcriptional regulator [Lacisediminihabitans sp.]
MSHELSQMGLSIKRIQVRHHRAADERLAPLGISLVQWDALRHMHENPDASLHDLAQLTFQTDQSFGTLATRMIDRDLIERVPGPGRAVRHRMTANGEKVRVQAEKVLASVLAESFGRLSDEEQQTFGDLLAKMVS